ncbi:MAG: UDP-N-acetylglucosamine 1-carboxyvinyltransferase [Firmicutes bacterium HGW-Firmicutes-8]|nr:MAG: UDP-N-acetylglucosamine 1-carboxyvinyltransferase [Firmicutes bacterium HGW-Firmicutes-8]
MEKFIIIGGKRLKGSIRVGGAKNAILPILAASLLTEGISTIHEVSRLLDVQVMKEVLTYLGAKIRCEGTTLMIDGSSVQTLEIAEDLMRKMRASNLVMGALLGRFGQVKVAYPGGCAIGSRPMDLHLKGFISLGANITEKHGYVIAETNGLRGAAIHLDFPSVGATENLIMAATQAQGQTIIRNSAKEPEIVDLQNFLNGLGAKIRGAGTDLIKIEGPTRLGSTTHTVIPDRIEAGTHMAAAAITGGDVVVENVIPEHVEAVTAKLREAGVEVEVGDDRIRVQGPPRPKAVDLKTLPYPGFPTDMQSQMMVLMTVAEGTGVISETVFENRYKHVDELRRMGADIKIEGRAAIIKGIPKLSGTFVEATDLRAGAALVLAGLIAEDATVIENVWHIDRGYEHLERKYVALGARIMRVNGI